MKTSSAEHKLVEAEDNLLTDYAATIIGECLSVFREWHGETLCEVPDVVHEAQIAVWVQRGTIMAASYPRCAIRVIARRAATKFLSRQHRQLRRYAEIGVSNERREAPDMP